MTQEPCHVQNHRNATKLWRSLHACVYCQAVHSSSETEAAKLLSAHRLIKTAWHTHRNYNEMLFFATIWMEAQVITVGEPS